MSGASRRLNGDSADGGGGSVVSSEEEGDFPALVRVGDGADGCEVGVCGVKAQHGEEEPREGAAAAHFLHCNDWGGKGLGTADRGF